MITKERLIEILESDYEFKPTLSTRKDMTAFILLSEIDNSTCDLLCHAIHDKVYFSTDVDRLCKLTVNEEAVELLASCGVMYDAEEDCLTMFV